MILALAAIYGTIAFVSNVLTTRFLADQWGRRKMILAGLGGIVLIEIYAAVMQREFQNTDNKTGKGFAVLGIYLFVVCYCRSPLPPSRETVRAGLERESKGGEG